MDGFADAAVVGAGPVGCVTALALASRGARVVLLEAHPAAATRLAGEWLHPAAVGVLRRLGLQPMTAPSGRSSGRGFVVFPDDDSAPIPLPYSAGAFIYRIGPCQVRACFDVPSYEHVRHDPAGALWEEYGDALPAGLRDAFHHALEARPVAWAANQFRPRSCYGAEGRALVGDAVGYFHPLTAVGLTLGFLDAECLARSPSYEAYRAERSSRSHVPELMATALRGVRHARSRRQGVAAAEWSIGRTSSRGCSRSTAWAVDGADAFSRRSADSAR